MQSGVVGMGKKAQISDADSRHDAHTGNRPAENSGPGSGRKFLSRPISARVDSWLPWLASAFSGVMWFTACPPHPGWWWAWVAVIPLLWAIRNAAPKKAFLLGWVGGFVMSLGGFWWLTDLFERFGHLPWPAALPITLIYSVYQGLIYALIALLYVLARRHIPGWLALALSAASVELLFPLVFPWYFAITQAYHPAVIQVAEFTGPIGVSVLMFLTGGALWDVWTGFESRGKPPWHTAIPLILVALSFIWGHWRIGEIRSRAASASKMKVALIQTGIGIYDGSRFFGAHQLIVGQKASQKAEQLVPGLDLLVWSESSYPYYVPRNQKVDFALPDGSPERRTVRRGFTTPLIMGSITVDHTGHYNSMILWDRQGRMAGLYDKNWLLVFGEYIPFYDSLTFLHSFFQAHNMSNLTHGHDVHLLHHEKAELGPMICYEDILTSYSRRLGRLGPQVLVNITNDAWFGPEVEPWEHMALAIYRSVEMRRPLIRTVNVGVTGIISPWGELIRHAPPVSPEMNPDSDMYPSHFRRKMDRVAWTQVTEGVWHMDGWPGAYIVSGEVPVMSGEETFYVHFGDLFAWMSVLALAALLGMEWMVRLRRGRIPSV